jgi:DNA-binding response OmpR family regulator
VRVLVVEDDAGMRDVLERGLRAERFLVDAARDGLAAEDLLQRHRFDVIVLDVVLPGHDGFAVCRRVRQRGIDTPILLLTGRHQTADRVRGLDAGADDYLPKPFAFEELTARLRALTRRGRTRHLNAVLTYGPVQLDQHDRVVHVHDSQVSMTDTEFRLLEYLLLRAEKLVTRDELVQHVWGDGVGVDSNVITVYISYLRRKLKPADRLLRTVRNVGYTLNSESAQP